MTTTSTEHRLTDGFKERAVNFARTDMDFTGKLTYIVTDESIIVKANRVVAEQCVFMDNVSDLHERYPRGQWSKQKPADPSLGEQVDAKQTKFGQDKTNTVKLFFHYNESVAPSAPVASAPSVAPSAPVASAPSADNQALIEQLMQKLAEQQTQRLMEHQERQTKMIIEVIRDEGAKTRAVLAEIKSSADTSAKKMDELVQRVDSDLRDNIDDLQQRIEATVKHEMSMYWEPKNAKAKPSHMDWRSFPLTWEFVNGLTVRNLLEFCKQYKLPVRGNMKREELIDVVKRDLLPPPPKKQKEVQDSEEESTPQPKKPKVVPRPRERLDKDTVVALSTKARYALYKRLGIKDDFDREDSLEDIRNTVDRYNNGLITPTQGDPLRVGNYSTDEEQLAMEAV